MYVLFYVILFKIVIFFFFFQAEDGIRDVAVTGVQTCALPISFYKPPDDGNFYHVICKLVYYPQSSENLASSPSSDEEEYDYEFFHQGYHITCKIGRASCRERV